MPRSSRFRKQPHSPFYGPDVPATLREIWLHQPSLVTDASLLVWPIGSARHQDNNGVESWSAICETFNRTTGAVGILIASRECFRCWTHGPQSLLSQTTRAFAAAGIHARPGAVLNRRTSEDWLATWVYRARDCKDLVNAPAHLSPPTSVVSTWSDAAAVAFLKAHRSYELQLVVARAAQRQARDATLAPAL